MAHDLMETMARSLKVDVLIVCEHLPTKRMKKGSSVIPGTDRWWSLQTRLSIMDIDPSDNLVKIVNIRVYACYWLLNTDFNAFENFLIRLKRSIRNLGDQRLNHQVT